MSERMQTPWRAEYAHSGIWKVWSEDGNEVAVCYNVPDTDDCPEARLIAAAPDLLEALKDARDMLCSHPDFQKPESLDKYDAVIAKAEARS